MRRTFRPSWVTTPPEPFNALRIGSLGRSPTTTPAWPMRGRCTYRNMRSVHIREYINQLQSETAPATVKQYLAAIREMFNALMRAGEIDVNPAYSVKAPRMSVENRQDPGSRRGLRQALPSHHRHRDDQGQKRQGAHFPEALHVRQGVRQAQDGNERLLPAKRRLSSPPFRKLVRRTLRLDSAPGAFWITRSHGRVLHPWSET